MSVANLRYLPVSSGTFVGDGTTAVVVADADVKLTSIIQFSLNTLAGTAPTHQPFVSAITPNTSFAVKTGTVGNTSVYNWVLYNLQA